jgi:putative DNA primase/helicase
MSARPDMPSVAGRLAGDMPSLMAALLEDKPTSQTGATLRWRSKGSLAVTMAGPKKGSWFDHEAGQGGDALGLVAHLRGSPMRDAWEWALRWLGVDSREGAEPSIPAPRPTPLMPTPPETSTTLDMARRIWREAAPPAGTLVEKYLEHRGLKLPPDAPLRFHPECPRGTERLPAMLALMTDPMTAEPCGTHRTFLVPDGRGKAAGQAKMMAGHAGLVRLVPDAEVTIGLGIAEGIETALRVMQGFGWSPVWAATSAGGIARFPVLAGIEELTIFADADDRGAGVNAALACAERWSQLARRVTILEPPAGTDFDSATGRAA